MKYILCTFIAVVLTASFTYSQSNFSIGLLLDVNSTRLGIERVNPNTLPVQLGETSLPGHGLTAGLQIVYDISDAFFIRSGIQFQQFYYNREIDVANFDSISGAHFTGLLQNRVRESSLGIPLEFGYRYTTRNEKFHLLGGGGLRGNFLLSERSRANLKPGANSFDIVYYTIENPLGKALLSSKLFAGFQWDYTEKFALGLEGYGIYHFRSVTPLSPDFEGESLVEPGMTARLVYKI